VPDHAFEEKARAARSDAADPIAVAPKASASNAAQAAKAAEARAAREGKGDAPAAPGAAYEALLGQWLGSQVYDAVSDLITLDKLASYARSGLEEGLGQLGGLLEKVDPANAAEVDEAVAALKKALGPKASAYVKANGAEFQKRLQGFVDANPIAIVVIALLAAAAAVAADMDIPELEHTFKVAPGLGVTLSAELGSLRNVTVEKIQASIKYAAGDLKVSAGATYEPGKEKVGAKLGLDYKVNDDVDLYGRGSWAADIAEGVNTTGANARAGVRWRPRKDMSLEAYGEMDQKRGAGAGINFKWTF
jgi:hypothetical protein